MAYRAAAAPQTEFQRKAVPLADDLITALEKEHIREVEVLYKDQLLYRAELERIIAVMQKDMLPREKQLHDLLDKVNESYAAATKDLHAKMSSQVGGLQSAKNQGKEKLLDPLADMENELRRITTLLQKPMADQVHLTPEQKRQVEQQVQMQQQRESRRPPTGSRAVFLCEQEQPPLQMFTPKPSDLSSQLDNLSPDQKSFKSELDQQVKMRLQDMMIGKPMAPSRADLPSPSPMMQNVFQSEQEQSPSQRFSQNPSAGSLMRNQLAAPPRESSMYAGNGLYGDAGQGLGRQILQQGDLEQSPSQRFSNAPSAGSLVRSQRAAPPEISMFPGNDLGGRDGQGLGRPIQQQQQQAMLASAAATDAAFNAIDRNHDGVITLSEFSAAVAGGRSGAAAGQMGQAPFAEGGACRPFVI